jgi:hypothetical protein
VFWLHVCLYEWGYWVPGTDLHTVVSCHVGAGNWTWVLWKKSFVNTFKMCKSFILFIYLLFFKKSQAWRDCLVIKSTDCAESQHLGGKGRQISEFEAGLVYKVSSRTARAIQRNLVSKNQTKKKKSSLRWVSCKHGLLRSRQRKPYKIIKTKRFRFSCLF